MSAAIPPLDESAPWPGTAEAIQDGCRCPRMDNRGRPLAWRIRRQDCPMHGWPE